MAQDCPVKWPNVCHSVVSLILDVCSGVTYYTPPGGCHSLGHLSILENDALHMFTILCISSPLVVNTLETHELRTSISSSRPVRFMGLLKKCASLRSLKLVFGAVQTYVRGRDNESMGDLSEGDANEIVGLTNGENFDDDIQSDDDYSGSDDDAEFVVKGMDEDGACYPKLEKGPQYKDLPLFLPDKIENLHIQGPLDMVNHLTPWLESAADATWLPDLKAISYRLHVHADSDSDDIAMPSPENNLRVSNAVQDFLDVLSMARPFLQIID